MLYFIAPILLVPTVTVVGASLFITFAAGRAVTSPDSATIPAEKRAAAMLELFACLRDGPAVCGHFDITVKFLDRISDGTFAYTPLAVTDPGEAVSGEQRRVKLDGLTAVQAQAVGAAVARVASVPAPARMTVTRAGDQLETVTFVEASLHGTVTFTRNADTYRLRSITYQPEGKTSR
ncbi:hypothetical protein AB0H83_36155 [Dactylosporangium sp. NPDC050688]|uniref:hypothetical protein n=1 Tax=Dactylosporangium sp. NPDC050688 TaxID=3157217 RepID=UPI0033D3A356